jgi:hypothetical protein
MAGKTAQPPPLPGETLPRVLRVAGLDGRMVLVFAGLFALLAAANRDGTGAITGVLAAGTGALELNAFHRLRAGDYGAMRWLVRAPLLLLGIILMYCGLRLTSFDPALLDQVMTPSLRQAFHEAGLAESDLLPFFQTVYQFTYGTVAIVAGLYQGGLARYYHRRRVAVRLDLAQVSP